MKRYHPLLNLKRALRDLIIPNADRTVVEALEDEDGARAVVKIIKNALTDEDRSEQRVSGL